MRTAPTTAPERRSRTGAAATMISWPSDWLNRWSAESLPSSASPISGRPGVSKFVPSSFVVSDSEVSAMSVPISSTTMTLRPVCRYVSTCCWRSARACGSSVRAPIVAAMDCALSSARVWSCCRCASSSAFALRWSVTASGTSSATITVSRMYANAMSSRVRTLVAASYRVPAASSADTNRNPTPRIVVM